MLASILSAVVVSPALGESATPTTSASVLRVGTTEDYSNLNPLIGYGMTDYEVWFLNYDSLFQTSAGDSTQVPDLAAEIPTQENGGVSEDGKTITLRLREGVTWQDGEPFTADDVVFTFNFVIRNQVGNWSAYTSSMRKVVVVDDHTVRFELTQPMANFTTSKMPILPAHIWSKIPVKEALNSYPNTAPIIGTGPFQTVEVKKGQYVKLVANDHYWKGRPEVDEVLVVPYTNATSMVSDLESGRLQAAFGIPPAEYAGVAGNQDINAVAFPKGGFDQLAFNCCTTEYSRGHSALRDSRFRQALNWAIDRERLASVAFQGFAAPGTSICPPDWFPASLDYHWQPAESELHKFDLPRASQLLDEAGYPERDGKRLGKDGKPIELRLFTRSQSPVEQSTGKLIAGWFEELGLRVELSVVDESAISDAVYSQDKAGHWAPDFDMFIWFWISDLDPDFILSVYTTDSIGGWNEAYYSNKEYDRLYALQRTILDPKERQQVVWQMQQIIYDQSPEIPLVYSQDLEAYNISDWAGWTPIGGNDGPVVFNLRNADSYSAAHRTQAETAAGGNGWLLPGVLVVVVVGIAAAAYVVRRHRRPHEETA